MYRDIEISVREGLVAKREVPPFRIKGLEAVGKHGPSENHAVLKLLGGDTASFRGLAVVAGVLPRLWIAAEVGMALGAEPVEGAAHVKFLSVAMSKSVRSMVEPRV